MRRVQRRRILAGTFALVTGFTGLNCFAGRANSAATRAATAERTDGLTVYRRRTLAFGTRVQISVATDTREQAQQALAAALAEIEQLDSILSLYRPDSAVCRLNRNGRLDNADPRLLELLSVATRWSQASVGAFDVTVQPLWDLYADAARQRRVPDDLAVQTTLNCVGWRHLAVRERSAHFLRPAMALSLNGIAQGYATDRALLQLRRHGVRHALVDAGEFAALGSRPSSTSSELSQASASVQSARSAQSSPWSVAVRHPRLADQSLGTVPMQDMALATSGDYEFSFSEDRVHHHIFDPRVGRSPLELAAVTVRANNATDADALSTACMVLGVEAGLALLNDTPGAQGLFVRKDQSLIKTAGFELLPAR